VFFAFEGEEAAGFCYTGIYPDECERRGVGVGHINLLGTVPEYRGRGVGRALLLIGIEYLRREVPIIELHVEGKNSNALALYKSAGFIEHRAWANLSRGQGSAAGVRG
jgi:ribosomal protein S18 acetylase RimI-like enzyme